MGCFSLADPFIPYRRLSVYKVRVSIFNRAKLVSISSLVSMVVIALRKKAPFFGLKVKSPKSTSPSSLVRKAPALLLKLTSTFFKVKAMCFPDPIFINSKATESKCRLSKSTLYFPICTFLASPVSVTVLVFKKSRLLCPSS